MYPNITIGATRTVYLSSLKLIGLAHIFLNNNLFSPSKKNKLNVIYTKINNFIFIYQIIVILQPQQHTIYERRKKHSPESKQTKKNSHVIENLNATKDLSLAIVSCVVVEESVIVAIAAICYILLPFFIKKFKVRGRLVEWWVLS